MTNKIVVLSTCGSPEEAAKLARELVSQRLAACVSIVAGVRSLYHWNGAVEDSQEALLLIKSTRELFPRLKTELSRLHSYEVPEIIVLPVVDGAEPYLAWIDAELVSNDSSRTK
jgi:periplasmic divalent cation tolerance protein